MKTYQVVTDNSANLFCKSDLIKKFKVIGENNRGRAELINEPKLLGLLGPMYNGKIKIDGEMVTCIRYETRTAYDKYSQ